MSSQTRVGLYERISQLRINEDDPSESKTATERQAEDLERFATARGFEVVDHFRDDDKSAFKDLDAHKDKDKGRKDFRRLLAAISEKRIDGVVGWKWDRLTRNVHDWSKLLKVCEQAGAFVLTMDGIDTRDGNGEGLATILTAVAGMEARNTSIRVKRKNVEWVKEGRPHAGGFRAFGYVDNKRSAINEQEAEHIKEAAKRLLNGDSVRAILRDWTERRIFAPGNATKPLTRFGFKRMITSAALSGQREHGGVLTPGKWSAILTPADTLTLRLIMNDPARRQIDSVRTYLLSGMVVCGLCGQPMRSRPYAGGKRRYSCMTGSTPGACGRMARLADPVEQWVTEMCLARLDSADLRDYLHRPSEDTAALYEAIKADKQALIELGRDYYVSRTISKAIFTTLSEELETKVRITSQRLAKANGSGVLGEWVGAGEAARDQWNGWPIERKRTIIGALVEQVVIQPATPGLHAFNPRHVEVTWRRA